MSASDSGLALVLGGGGARAAYQVGVLKSLARRFPELAVPYLTGVSAGAINAAFLASRPDSWQTGIEHLEGLWGRITVERVFESDSLALLKSVLRWGARLVSGGTHVVPPTRGMVDTAPLREFLTRELDCSDPAGPIAGIASNVERGHLRALALTTTDYATGQSITWVQGREPPMWRRPHRRSVEATITVDHVMASSALPLFFPAVRLGEHWHGDGGIRLTAPLSPALHLGAGRILVVSTRHLREQSDADEPQIAGYPPPAQVLGLLMSAVFLDMLDFDAMLLQRINELLERLPEDQRGGLRPVRSLVLRPSVNLGKLAGAYELALPRPFRFMTRGLGTRETKSPDSLSMLLFEPAYTRRLMEIGEADAEARAEEIEAFLTA